MNLPHREPIGVLIVDDSPFMRLTIQKILNQDAGIRVLDTARDGKEGIYKLQALKPQVVIMDVEMPVINGLQALEEIMRWQPTPVIVFSSVTTEGAEATLKAFDLGAFDVVAKPSGMPGSDLNTLSRELIEKVRAAANVDPARLNKNHPLGRASIPSPTGSAPSATVTGKSSLVGDSPGNRVRIGERRSTLSGTRAALGNQTVTAAGTVTIADKALPRSSVRSEPGSERSGGGTAWPKHPVEIVGIGTSTGGPSALQAVLPQLPADFPVPVVVAQHMPVGFTGPLAKRLDAICSLHVKEGVHGEVVQKGTIYIAPAGKQTQVKRQGNQLVLSITDDSPIKTLYHPSVDVLFMSLAREVGKGVLGVVMTGMGHDGTQGVREIKNLEGFAVAEAEESCVVYGMPKSVIEAGLADRVVPLKDIGRVIVECVLRR